MKILKKLLKWTGTTITIVLVTIALLICFSVKWMFDTWTNISLDELLFHLTAPLEGTNQDMILEYIKVCVVPTIVILLLCLTVLLSLRKTKKYYLIMIAGIVVAFIVTIGVLYYAGSRLEVDKYIEAQNRETDFIKENYVDPAEINLTFPEQKRNLIYIFLESMETTYADKANGGAFEQNVIPELTQIAQENEDFSGSENLQINGAYPMSGSTWTMGAMFAHTSGLPLNISIEVNDMDTQNTFFPGIITLGDILEEEGYSQTLMVGSEAKFGGRELYFNEHGNYDIVDYVYASENGMIPPGYKVWWGFEDQKLFEFAKEKLMELSAQGNPFNLTLLTVDTHFEDGWVCEQCPTIYGEDQYSNVMACSSRQLEEFLNWIKLQSFYENTTIVLAGDHLTMDSDYCSNVNTETDKYERKDYVAYINSDAETTTERERTYTTFDHFPTTLSALGVEIEGNRLGLGTNLFSEEPTLIEILGYGEMDLGLKGKSAFMEEIAQIDKNTEELMRREGRLPEANVWAEAYQYEIGGLPVFVSGITGIPAEIASISVAAWTEPDQSDTQWTQLTWSENEFGEYYYYGYVNVPDFNYKTGEYYIQAYAVDVNGEQHFLGETTGMVY